MSNFVWFRRDYSRDVDPEHELRRLGRMGEDHIKEDANVQHGTVNHHGFSSGPWL